MTGGSGDGAPIRSSLFEEASIIVVMGGLGLGIGGCDAVSVLGGVGILGGVGLGLDGRE